MSSGLTTGIIAVALANGKVSIDVPPMARKQKKTLKRCKREFKDIMKGCKPFSIEEYKKSMTPQEYSEYCDEGLLTKHFLGDD